MKVKVFSATRHTERNSLGETVTAWLEQTSVSVTDYKVLQSSDSEYHCLSIVIFYE